MSTSALQTKLPLPSAQSAEKAPTPSMVIVGKDVLELLSSAMYVDPLSIFREYVQNAADAIEEARASGVLTQKDAGRVEIRLDSERRSIVIRDNGAGIPIGQAAQRLLAIGASTKRGTRARGFRGVGRLAGLAYGRALIFRTRSAGDDQVIELRWDCQRLKTALRDICHRDDIASVIERVVTIRALSGRGWPRHFFEVELSDVIRTKRDALLSETAVVEYLEQVAPVPFTTDFRWAPEITRHLESVRLADLEILVGERPAIVRPFRDHFKLSDSLDDEFSELELLTFNDLDGGIAAVGWVLHHRYLGSITVRSQIGGLRARVGNVQVGTDTLLEDFFPETRFNGWAVGEIHILDPRIVPNARRDDFEQNVHYSNITAQLEPIARQIARRARSASITRNRARRDKLQIERAVKEAESTNAGAATFTPLTLSVAQTGQAGLVAEPERLKVSHRRLLKSIMAVVGRSSLADSEKRTVLRAAIEELV